MSNQQMKMMLSLKVTSKVHLCLLHLCFYVIGIHRLTSNVFVLMYHAVYKYYLHYWLNLCMYPELVNVVKNCYIKLFQYRYGSNLNVIGILQSSKIVTSRIFHVIVKLLCSLLDISISHEHASILTR